MTAALWLASSLIALSSPAPFASVTPSSAPGPDVIAGAPAPDFAYRSTEQRWTRLDDALAGGDVLLVIGAGEPQIVQLQRERAALIAHGVIPIAVIDMKDSPAWSLAQRLGVTFSLLSDPRHDIASAYRVAESADGRPGQAWFAIDRDGRVRACGRRLDGIPSFNDLACASFGTGVTIGAISDATQ